jgi:membrane protein implicated in regulation of membrane protease activity
MKRTNDEIEEPVRKSPWVLVGGVLILLLLLALGIFLLVEALKTPDGPQDVLDTKRMIASGIGVILFSIAVFFFLVRLYKPSTKTKKPVKRKSTKRKKSSKR